MTFQQLRQWATQQQAHRDVQQRQLIHTSNDLVPAIGFGESVGCICKMEYQGFFNDAHRYTMTVYSGNSGTASRGKRVYGQLLFIELTEAVLRGIHSIIEGDR